MGYVYITAWWYTYPSEEYDFVSWDDEIPNIWKNEKCSKPPTRKLAFADPEPPKKNYRFPKIRRSPIGKMSQITCQKNSLRC